MHGTHSTIGATLCGVILPNGRDCNGAVPEGVPFNLCAIHVQAVYVWQRDNDRTLRSEVQCPLCDRFRALPGNTAGVLCDHCGYESDDYDGPGQKSGAEADRMALRSVNLTALGHLAQKQPHPELVYYIRFGDRIKIGTSTNFATRLQALPHDEVLGVEPGGQSIERRRHREFAAHRITGEWFHATPELLAHARSLMGDTKDWYIRARQWAS